MTLGHGLGEANLQRPFLQEFSPRSAEFLKHVRIGLTSETVRLSRTAFTLDCGDLPRLSVIAERLLVATEHPKSFRFGIGLIRSYSRMLLCRLDASFTACGV